MNLTEKQQHDLVASLQTASIMVRGFANDVARTNPALCNRAYAIAHQWEELLRDVYSANPPSSVDPLGML